MIGAERIIEILDEVEKYFSLENLAELSIELNPYPTEDMYAFVDAINTYGKKYAKIRYSFGIQSLDNKILSKNQRHSSFTGIVDFLRGLRPYKRDNVFFNLDFIAFGEFNDLGNWELALWSDSAWGFYNDLVESHFIDSFSIYTLELFPWSLSFYEKESVTQSVSEESRNCDIDSSAKPQNDRDKDDLISDEFALLKQVVEEEGYQRYEISNFALPGKSSIHNHVYWTMENYLGIGTSASWFVNKKLLDKLSDEQREKLLEYWGIQNVTQSEAKSLETDTMDSSAKPQNDREKSRGISWIRRTNTLNLESYWDDKKRVAIHEVLDERAYLIDEFFLIMRTSMGVRNLEKYKTILVENYQALLSSFAKEGLVKYDIEQWTLTLTDEGMNVYNSIITDLVEF